MFVEYLKKVLNNICVHKKKFKGGFLQLAHALPWWLYIAQVFLLLSYPTVCPV